MATGPRRRARILALLALYEADTSRHLPEEALERLAAEGLGPDPEAAAEDDIPVSREPEREDVAAFARRLVAGVQAHRPAIDAIIAQAAPQFPVEDVAVIDRNVLRLAVYEVLFDNETPVRAAVNEAVDLAKTFGSESAPQFVDGVLGTVSDKATR